MADPRRRRRAAAVLGIGAAGAVIHARSQPTSTAAPSSASTGPVPTGTPTELPVLAPEGWTTGPPTSEYSRRAGGGADRSTKEGASATRRRVGCP